MCPRRNLSGRQSWSRTSTRSGGFGRVEKRQAGSRHPVPRPDRLKDAKGTTGIGRHAQRERAGRRVECLSGTPIPHITVYFGDREARHRPDLPGATQVKRVVGDLPRRRMPRATGARATTRCGCSSNRRARSEGRRPGDTVHFGKRVDHHGLNARLRAGFENARAQHLFGSSDPRSRFLIPYPQRLGPVFVQSQRHPSSLIRVFVGQRGTDFPAMRAVSSISAADDMHDLPPWLAREFIWCCWRSRRRGTAWVRGSATPA